MLITSCGGGSGSGSEPSPLPDVTDLGGPVMAHPKIVPIFYANDADTATLTSFSQWIVNSQWIQTAGADYGVGTGSVLKVVQRTDAAPAMIDDTQIVSLLYAGLADGSLPGPVGGPADVLYMIYFPAQTTVTGPPGQSCVDFGGYHLSARQGGVELSYAVVAACHNGLPTLTDVESREATASHELIEAATNPVPFNHPSFGLNDPGNSWFLSGHEVGDLCQRGDGKEIWRESGFVAQRIWSISAAAAEHDPCVPGAGTDYANLAAQSAGVPRIAPGGHRAITLRGWASGAEHGTSWPIQAVSLSMPEETLTLSAPMIKDGATVSLDVAVPASAQVGSFAQFVVLSRTEAAVQQLPMYAVVGEQCSQFTSCETCTAEFGCGFCASSGKCEALDGLTSSAESSCSGSSFATSPGSCNNSCATFGDSCGDCTSQPGCGWCSSGQQKCVALSPYTGQQLSGSCPDADWSVTPDYCSQ